MLVLQFLILVSFSIVCINATNSSPRTNHHLSDVTYTANDHAEALRNTRKSMERHEKGWSRRLGKANRSQAFFCFNCFNSKEDHREIAREHHEAIRQNHRNLAKLINKNTEIGQSSPKTTKKLKYEIGKANKKMKNYTKNEKFRNEANERHDIQQYILHNHIEGYSSDDSWLG